MLGGTIQWLLAPWCLYTSMDISTYRRLNKNERWPCTRKTIKGLFHEFDELSVCFGLTRQFRFDSTFDRKKPKLVGTVISSISSSPLHASGRQMLLLFPIKIKEYGEEALLDFRENVLPSLQKWLINELAKPETDRERYKHLIVEWMESEHRIHVLAN